MIVEMIPMNTVFQKVIFFSLKNPKIKIGRKKTATSLRNTIIAKVKAAREIVVLPAYHQLNPNKTIYNLID